MMNRKIALMLYALPLGAASLLAQSATAAESSFPTLERQAPVVVAQRYDGRNERDRREDARREAIRREEMRREEIRQEETRRAPRRVWIPGHWESGFLGIGRKWVEGHWEDR